MAVKKEFNLDSKTVGVLPIVNHFLQRLKVKELFDRYLPPPDPRTKLDPARVLGVLLRNLIVCRMPLYSVGQWAQQRVPVLLGLEDHQIDLLNDDRIGRSLDRFFDADRSALVTDFVVHLVQAFDVNLEQFHNDSTSLTLHGQYADADGSPMRGKPTLAVTFGHNKDHRQDLKQLLWILTVSEDGAIPVHFKVADGNTEDSTTHIETWEVLKKLVGSAEFLYVADCKLCTRENLHYIDKRAGRFITVLPRSRKEDNQFKQWLQDHVLQWQEIAQYPHPRLKNGEPDILRAVEAPIPEADGYRLIWFHSSHKRQRDSQSRQDAINRALKGLGELKAKLEGPRCRYSTKHGVAEAAEKILREAGASGWVLFEIKEYKKESYRQEIRGRPGTDTRWRRKVKIGYRLSWHSQTDRIAYDARTDGIFPLVTNDRKASMLEILTAYKCKQPLIEKRHDLLKNTLEVTPAFLKNIGRLEAFLSLSYIAITVHAIIERHLRMAMADRKIDKLPLYPEGRQCRTPTMTRLIDNFEPLQRHVLLKGRTVIQQFAPELTDVRRQLLDLLGLSSRAYQKSWQGHRR